jgi:hypothetical protein
MTFTPGSGSTGTLSGSFTGKPNQIDRLEIFSNPSAPAAGHEQGKTLVLDVAAPTDGSGNASFSVTEPLGFYTADVTDQNGNTGELASAAQSQPLAASITTVSSSANPSIVGQQVTFTAVVTAPGSQGTPTGLVTFTIDGQAQSPVALAVVGAAGDAQFVTSTLTAGQHSVTAAYAGDTAVSPSNGSPLTQTVNAPGLPASTTSLESSTNPSTTGQPVTFTAVVQAPGFQGTPTGTVTFTIDGHAQTPVSLAVVGGKEEAQFVTSTLAAGQHSITAAYSGDAHVNPSSGSLLTQTVKAPSLHATTTTVVSSLNPSTVGQQVTFTAIVSPGASAGALTGTVTFTIDGTAEAPVRLQAVKGKEEAVFSVSTLTKGTHKVSATYNGDATFAASSVASPLVQTVAPAPTSAPGDPPKVVSLLRFGIHMQPTVLEVKFSGALDPTSAGNVNNYVIVDPSGRRVRVDSAIYNPQTCTVTLRPATRINLHHTYHFTVIGTGQGGVRSVNNVMLDGAGNGDSGSNYVVPLDGNNVVWTPAERRKYLHPKHQTPAGALAHNLIGRHRA